MGIRGKLLGGDALRKQRRERRGDRHCADQPERADHHPGDQEALEVDPAVVGRLGRRLLGRDARQVRQVGEDQDDDKADSQPDQREGAAKPAKERITSAAKAIVNQSSGGFRSKSMIE